jgi:hypothetical protein
VREVELGLRGRERKAIAGENEERGEWKVTKGRGRERYVRVK